MRQAVGVLTTRYLVLAMVMLVTPAFVTEGMTQPLEMDFTQPQKKRPVSAQTAEPSPVVTALQSARTTLARAQRLEEGGTPADELTPLFEEACEAYRLALDAATANSEFVDMVLEHATACRGAKRPVEAAEWCVRAATDERAMARRGEMWLCGVHSYRHAIRLAEADGKLPASGPLVPDNQLVVSAVATMEKLKEESLGDEIDRETRLRVLWLASELHERMGRRDKAESLSWYILHQKPSIELAQSVSAQLLSPAQNARDWDAVAAILEKLRDMELASASETQQYRVEWGQLWESLAIRRAQEAENANKWDDAAAFRSQAAEVAMDVADVARARYQAAFALDKAGRLAEARTAYETVLRDFPDSDVAPLTMLSLGTAALKLHDPSVAADLFVRYSERYPSGEHAVDALLQGVQLLINDNRLADATVALERFVGRTSGDQELQMRVFLADLYEKTGAIEKGLAQYEATLANSGLPKTDQVMVHTRAGLLCERLKKDGLARNHFAAAVKIATENGIDGVWADRSRAKVR